MAVVSKDPLSSFLSSLITPCINLKTFEFCGDFQLSKGEEGLKRRRKGFHITPRV